MEGDNHANNTPAANTAKITQPDMPAPLCKALIRYMGGDTAAQTRLDSTRNAQGKQVIWLEVLGFLNELGYQGTRWETVQSKWNNLCSRFKEEKSKAGQSGAAYEGSWLYYNDMMESVGARPKFTRVAVVDSSGMRNCRKKARKAVAVQQPSASNVADEPLVESGSDPEFVEEDNNVLDSSGGCGDNSFHSGDMPRFLTGDGNLRERWSKMTPQQKHIFLTSKQMKADEEEKEKNRTLLTEFMTKQQASLDSSAETLNRFVTAYEKKAAPPVPALPVPATTPPVATIEVLKSEVKSFMDEYAKTLYGGMQQQFAQFLEQQQLQPVVAQEHQPHFQPQGTHVRVVHGLSKNYLAQQIQSSAQSNEQQQERHVCQELGCDKEAFYGYSGLKLSCHDHCAEDMEFIRPL